jgi:hypothetical protein
MVKSPKGHIPSAGLILLQASKRKYRGNFLPSAIFREEI